jgi:hypothetical protein
VTVVRNEHLGLSNAIQEPMLAEDLVHLFDGDTFGLYRSAVPFALTSIEAHRVGRRTGRQSSE